MAPASSQHDAATGHAILIYMIFGWTKWLSLALFLGAVFASPDQSVTSNTRFHPIKQLEAEYELETNRVIVRWQENTQAKQYQVRVYQSGDLLLSSSTTRHRKRFQADNFTEGTSYRVWVRVKATQQKKASTWRKLSYTFMTKTDDEDSEESSVLDDTTHITTSTDPNAFTDSTTTLFELASVPEIVLLSSSSAVGEAGDLLMYYVDFSEFEGAGDETIAMSRSTDNGATWSEPVNTVFTGQQNAGANVDPSVVQLSDGSLRLYFFGSEIVDKSTVESAGQNIIYSATSTDGINFTVEDGQRFGKENIMDPEVIYFNDQWIMYYSLGETSGIATSVDGLTFDYTGSAWDGGGVPGAYVESNSLMRIYGCQGGVINAQASSDGITFVSGEVTENVLSASDYIVCDPSPVLLPDGRVVMAYKKRPA